MKKKVIFLIRAHNDFDCRLPLIFELEKNSNFEIFVMNYPTNNGYYYMQFHQLFEKLKLKKIKVISFINETGFLTKFFYNINFLFQFFFLKKFNFNRSSFFFNRFFFILDKIVIFLAKSNLTLDKLLYDNSLIVLDEIILSKKRSFFLSKIYNLKNYSKIISIQTGQDTYLNLKRKLSKTSAIKEEISVNNFFVPSLNDQKIFKKKGIANKMQVVGNPRFDPNWIKYLNQNCNVNIKKKTKLRCSFLLSKFEYGIIKEKLIKVINEVSMLNNCEIIIKPHTRGMEMDEIFLKYKNNKSVINGTNFSSTEIIKWSNLVFFTGSSIIFQALLLNKKCIYLDYVLSCRTIFFQSDALIQLSNISELKEIIKIKKIDKKKVNNFIKKHVFNSKKKICLLIK